MNSDSRAKISIEDSESKTAPRPDTAIIHSEISFVLLLFTLVWLPIPKAGKMPGGLPLLCVCAALIFLTAAYSLAITSPERKTQKQALVIKNSVQWSLVWLAFSASIIMHSLFIPKLIGIRELFSNEVWSTISEAGNSRQSVLPSLRVWCFFTCMWIVAWRISWLRETQITKLFFIVFLASSFQAIFGLVHFLSGGSSILGLWVKEYYLTDATGTFVNRNHFSGMLAICWPLVLSALLTNRPKLFIQSKPIVRWIIAVFYSSTVMLAIISSHSRMGTAAALLGLSIWGIVYIRSRRLNNSPMLRWAPNLTVVFTILFSLLLAVWFGVEDVLERYTVLENGDTRIQLWSALFNLPIRAWLIGIGPGNFEDVFRLIQPAYMKTRTIHAHNDYLEFLLEFGVVFAGIIVLSILHWLHKLLPRGDMSLRAGALGSLAAIALHSLVDFNLQVPGSAIFFWVAVGVMMNSTLLSNEIRPIKSDPVSTAPMKDRGIQRKRVRKSKRRRSKKSRSKQDWITRFRSD